MGSFGGGGGGGGVQFFPNQQDFAGDLFAEGGFFRNLLSGAPNPAFEAGAERSRQALGNDFASRGLEGSGLETRSLTDLETGIAQGREQDLFQRILSGIQPAGTFTSGGGGGLLGSVV